MTDVRIFITNLAKYNNGELAGEWVDLPQEEEELKAVCGRILDGVGEELFITDYEADFNVGEYDSIPELNAFVEELEALDEHEQDKICYLITDAGYDRQGALDVYENCVYCPDMDLQEVAEEMVNDGYCGTVPAKLENYIDYDAIARDLDCNGYHETDKGVFLAP